MTQQKNDSTTFAKTIWVLYQVESGLDYYSSEDDSLAQDLPCIFFSLEEAMNVQDYYWDFGFDTKIVKYEIST